MGIRIQNTKKERKYNLKASSTAIKRSVGLIELGWQEDIVHLSLSKTAPTLQCSLAKSVGGVPRARLQAAFQLLQ
jgi:hypothetical protein